MESVNDLQEQVSDLKHMLRSVLSVLNDHLMMADSAYKLHLRLDAVQRKHHDSCTEREQRRAKEGESRDEKDR